jgi:hypothetical protein
MSLKSQQENSVSIAISAEDVKFMESIRTNAGASTVGIYNHRYWENIGCLQTARWS